MSIALPVRRRRPAAWGGRVCRSTERPSSAFPTIVEFVAAPVAILLGATFFTGAVEILGGRSGLRQGAVGSRLAGGDTEGGAELPEKSVPFSWVNGRQRRPGFREHDRGHDLMGEAERRQR